MPFNEAVDERIVRAISGWGAVRRKMFGGTCHLLQGNMMCGVYKNDLILRLGVDQAQKALQQDHVKPFDITGKPMKGWVMVKAAGFEGERLAQWLHAARRFVESLPAK